MLARIACFSLGILILQHFSQLPSWYWLLLFFVMLLAAKWCRALQWPLWVMLGMLWCAGHAWWLLQQGIDEPHEGQDLLLSGEIISIPEQRERGVRFLFSVDPHSEISRPLGRIQLNWYGRVPGLQIGEHWQLKVRLKKPNGFMNPGGFDYEGWLFHQRIRAKGYVRSGERDQEANQRLASSDGHWVDRYRHWLSEKIDQALPGSEFTGMIKALSIGLRQQMSESQWQVLTATGTNHLMAISGLHVGLVAGMVILIVSRLWRLSATLCLLLPSKKAGAVAGLMAALFYAAMAGFAIPTQRALIMLTVVLGGLLLQRQMRAAPVLSLAWFLVLLIDPFAILSMGFWLSFAAVAIILYSMGGRSHTRGLGWRFFRVHWIIGIGLAPLLLFAFQQAPVYTFVANFIAVPVVGLLVVPLVLLAVLLMPFYTVLSGWLLLAVDQLFQWLWPILEAIANWPAAQWIQQQPPLWTLFCALLGVLLLLAPRGWPGRWVGLFWIAPILLVLPPRPNIGELWVTVLDVGQGLSVVVETANHTLIYDTGAARGRMDSAKMVLLPYLRSRGISRIDRLLISHDDRDHSGGADTLLKGVAVGELLTPDIERFRGEPHQTCRTGYQWQWDGVQFSLLHPEEPLEWRADNNRSCLLQIQSVGGSVLIPGDIERPVESRLVKQYGDRLASDILVAGHHGSNSSSSVDFIDAVSPQYVIYATGYRNRYQFPHSEVVQRFSDRQVKQLNSAESGAIRFKILPQQGILAPEEFRMRMRRLWHRH